ncbi:hypothetical protein EST38_g12561 [Candolleomyces aberdarensis]|uniref:CENP-C homolog n=1 Tax=Candolleomyces aberdarensis TaxID=2316362 RepID=A0A4Q2D245_9AGAR|nr:hypothetical protein EST38_g12561 [Candolleomyces aberdarensis]
MASVKDSCMEPASTSDRPPSPQESSVSGELLQLCDQKLKVVDIRIAALVQELEELKAQRSVIEEEKSQCAYAQPSAPGSKVVTPNPEDGWDDDTPSIARVLDFNSGQQVERRVAWTAKMANLKPVPNNSWSYEKIFGDEDFIAAGQLVIPPNSQKPSKATKDNTYMFYVVEGAVKVKVHDTCLVLAPGGTFMVPRGNLYSIENVSQRDAKLFFTQARKMMNRDDEELIALANWKSRERGSSGAGVGVLASDGGHGGAKSVADGDETLLAIDTSRTL